MKQEPLVEPLKVLFPPLHIKLGIIKQFIKQLDPEGEAFKHIQELFQMLSEAKTKAGVFVGPRVKQLITPSAFLRSYLRLRRQLG